MTKNTLHWGSTPHYVRYGDPEGYCKCRVTTSGKLYRCDPCREKARREEE